MAKMQGFQNRRSAAKGPEDFPTPPWATRALLEHGLGSAHLKNHTVWEPAANRGYMVRPLAEYFGTVIATDKHDYGAGYPTVDFLDGPTPQEFGMDVDWIITNPPFALAEEFVHRALALSKRGVAVFVRASWIEGKGRYENLFSVNPPTLFCPFVERVALVEGRVDPKAVTQMPYAWFVWDHGVDTGETVVRWIPPCRKEMERDDDYPGYDQGPVV